MAWCVTDYVKICAIIDDTKYMFYGKIIQVRDTTISQECLFELIATTSEPRYYESLVPQWWVNSEDLSQWNR